MKRLEKIDMLRGIAIVLMVLFHINYILINFFGVEILNFSMFFWLLLGKISALLFIFISGISFFLSEHKYGNKIINKYIIYAIYLGLISLTISFLTYILFNGDFFIRFGIIHYFALSFLLILFFRKFRYYNLVFSIFIILYGFYFIPVIESKYYYFLGFTYPGFKSADYYPIIPYFGIILLGYVFALYLNDIKRLNLLELRGRKNNFTFILEKIGKNSLIIYLTHTPIILIIFYLLFKII